ncbi:PDCD5-related protein [Mycena maculata]|uniref:PDCD5-related protein n=1 Tax=Mycena maculata TaxID=230809 RepID=A0AAD7N123_9AGAR|nr:PDCD5-related protein [Mycena maculata]
MEGVTQTNPAQQRQQQQQQGAEDEAAKRAQEEQMRRDVMATVLDTAARERLSRIALVSPERSKQIEGILMRMVQSGQLRGRVSEEQLIDLLEQMEEAQGKTTAKKSTIVFQRRKDPDDDFDF